MASILIIEDDIHVAGLLRSHFSDEGYQVSVVHRGEEGLAAALKATPDLILLDVILPDATGFQMCNQFRRTAATQAVPIIVMTGVARFPNQQAFAMERGANEYVLKPFKILEMGELVDKYIGSKRTQPKTSKPLPAPSPETAVGDLSELQNFLKQAIQKSKYE